MRSVLLLKCGSEMPRIFCRSAFVRIGCCDLDPAAGLRRLVHQVGLRADVGHQRHHELLADRIDRRIRHLREQLLEILEQELRPIGQHRERRIRSHRRDRFFAGHDHRRDHHLELFDRVTERLLPLADRRMVRLRNVQRFRQLVERDTVLGHPAAIGLAADDIGFDLLVIDDPALHGVDKEHAAGLQPALHANVFRRSAGNTPASDASTTVPSVVTW